MHALLGSVVDGRAGVAQFTIVVRFTFILHFGYLTFRLATGLQIAGYTKVSITANARGPMVIGHTQGIGTTLYFRTGIDTFA